MVNSCHSSIPKENCALANSNGKKKNFKFVVLTMPIRANMEYCFEVLQKTLGFIYNEFLIINVPILHVI